MTGREEIHVRVSVSVPKSYVNFLRSIGEQYRLIPQATTSVINDNGTPKRRAKKKATKKKATKKKATKKKMKTTEGNTNDNMVQ